MTTNDKGPLMRTMTEAFLGLTGVSAITGEFCEPAQANLDRMIGASADVTRSFSRSVGQRGAAMGCDLFLVSTRNVSNANPTAIAFSDERWDSDSLHQNSTNNTRITVPAGGDGLWLVRGTIEYATQATGTSREAMIYLNGGARAADRRTPVDGRATVVNVEMIVAAVAGDYFELYGYQNSGITLAAGVTFTRFQANRLGDAIGNFTSSKGAVLFGADVKYKGFDRYARVPSVQPSSRVYIADDPVLGPSRQAIHVQVTNADNSVTYPRAQFQSPSSLTAGDDVYIGLAIYVPADMASMTGTRSPVIHEIYGPPTSGYGPNVLRIRDDKLALEPLAIYNTDGTPTGKFLAWSLPLAGLKGKWVDVVHRVKLSTDAAVGLQELWVNTGTGWVQQSLRDPDSGSTVGTTLNIATLRAGVNDSGNNFSSLKVAYTDYSIGDVTLWYADHVVATSLDAAKPSSY